MMIRKLMVAAATANEPRMVPTTEVLKPRSWPSTGTAKMRWSMMKRMGRGLAAISSRAST